MGGVRLRGMRKYTSGETGRMPVDRGCVRGLRLSAHARGCAERPRFRAKVACRRRARSMRSAKRTRLQARSTSSAASLFPERQRWKISKRHGVAYVTGGERGGPLAPRSLDAVVSLPFGPGFFGRSPRPHGLAARGASGRHFHRKAQLVTPAGVASGAPWAVRVSPGFSRSALDENRYPREERLFLRKHCRFSTSAAACTEVPTDSGKPVRNVDVCASAL